MPEWLGAMPPPTSTRDLLPLQALTTIATPHVRKHQLLEQWLREHRHATTVNLDRVFPFSINRTFLFMFSIVLFVSDVVRGGLAKRDFPDKYVRVDPSIFMQYGPLGYPVQSSNSSQTNSNQHSRWEYKYDTTSVGMRAVASFFNLSAWPPCMLYRSHCSNDTIGFQTIFHMLDSVVDAIARSSSGAVTRQHRSAVDPLSLTMRHTYWWIDRLHHYVAPQIFQSPLLRTTRSLYFNTSALLFHLQRGFCAMPRRSRPYACADVWVNWRRVRVLRDPPEHSGDVFTDARIKLRAFQTTYPTKQFTHDLLLIDSTDDLTRTMMAAQGARYFDVVLIMRARQCDAVTGQCSTVAIQDYRYEGGVNATNLFDWYVIVATLRLVGQLYVWVRLALLWGGCYVARSSESEFQRSSGLARLLIATRTMLMIPSQVLIYGSLFPITCYTLAHWIDSPAIHDFIADQYRALPINLNIDPVQFMRTSTMLMRNVWPLAIVIHLLILQRTAHCWSWSSGIVGISEFWISITSALTTVAHYRLLSIRNSNVMSVHAVADNNDVAMLRARRYRYLDGIDSGQSIDFKMLLVALPTVSVLMALLGLVLRVCAHQKHAQTRLYSRTFVSYAGGELWPLDALAVTWNSSVITTDTHRRTRATKVADVSLCSATKCQNELSQPDDRAHDAHALILVMNLCMLTDPFSFWRARLWCGVDVALVKSQLTGQTHMLPVRALRSPDAYSNVVWDTMEVVVVVNSRDVS